MLEQFPDFDIPRDARSVLHEQEEIVDLVLPQLRRQFPGVEFDVEHVIENDDAAADDDVLLEVDAASGRKVWLSANRLGGWYIGVSEASPVKDSLLQAMRCFARGWALCVLFYPSLWTWE